MDQKLVRLEDVQREANSFLQKFHPEDTLPIPIEEIVELRIGINLSVISGIKQLLDVDAFITNKFTEIFVDALSFQKFAARTRFSIAHEIGHLVLHREWYEENGPDNIDDYIKFLDKIDEESYKKVERQASTFAGLVLLPTNHIANIFKQRLGILPRNEEPELLSGVIQDLPAIFNVSEMPVLWRLMDEGIIRRRRFF